MLYDPKWNPRPVNSVEGLIAWLETKDPTTVYDYNNFEGQCMICQYLRARGIADPTGDYGKFLTSDARIQIAAEGAMTFGAALSRARGWRDEHALLSI